jgi:tRNA(fMet)-specific endonuclease VapC
VTRHYMLDTNIVSELARNPHGPLAERIAAVGPAAIGVSIVTAAELRYGCARKGSPRLLAQIEAILAGVQVLALDVPADSEYGGIRAELEAAGQPIGPNDLLIAAHACALDAVLVTANVREFSRVRALKVENWLA